MGVEPALHRSCPVCGSTSQQPCLRKGALTLVRCGACSMRFASPVPQSLVDGEHYSSVGRSYYTSPEKLAGDFNPDRFRRELNCFRRFCPGGRVLDVGCNTGAFLEALRRAFPGQYAVQGVDVSAPAVAYARSLGLDVHLASRDGLGIQGGGETFAAVTFWAVLEHVVHPVKLLGEAAARVRPGGHVFVLVPHAGSLAFRLLGSRYRYVMAEHVNYFDRRSLLSVAARVPGLTPVWCRTTHFNPVVLVQDAWRPRLEVAASDRARLMRRTQRWKVRGRACGITWLYDRCEWLLGCGGLADNLLLVLRKH